VEAEKAGSRGPAWNRRCCVGGVLGGDVMVPSRTCHLISEGFSVHQRHLHTVLRGGSEGLWLSKSW
jgi:hypothetical protein